MRLQTPTSSGGTPVSTQVPSRAQALSLLPDFRQAKGKRYDLLPILLLCWIAMMCGCSSQAAISDWGRNYSHHWLWRLGFKRCCAPSQSPLHRIFKGIDVEKLELLLSDWCQRVFRFIAASMPAPLQAAGIDGKRLCGSSKQQAAQPHLLAGLSHKLGLVLGQVAVAEKSHEITACFDLIEMLVLEGLVITGDAMFTQRQIAEKIISKRGDYLLSVKANQPSLLEEIKQAFTPQWWMSDPLTEAKMTDAYGGRIEERSLKASTAMCGYSDWPGLRRVLKMERKITTKRTGVERQEEAYAITRLDEKRASAEELLKLWREHWHIENKLHYVRDVTFKEDKSQVRRGKIPQVMAALRNAAITMMRVAGATNIAAACRRYAAQPGLAMTALGLDLQE
jgi:predicted transposase YbfD/YdcC